MKTPPRHVVMPASVYADDRLTLLDHKLIAHIASHLDRNGWLVATPAQIGTTLGRSRESINQRLVKLCAWGYVERRGSANAWEWRVILDPDDAAVAEAVTASPATAKTSKKTTTGDAITRNRADALKLVTPSPTGDAVTKVGDAITSAYRETLTGDAVTSPTPPKKKQKQTPFANAQGDVRKPEKRASLPPEFEEFWASAHQEMRDRSDAKPVVAKVWAPIAAEVGADRLTAALKAFAATDDAQRGFGLAGLQTWLRKGRYERFLPKPLTDDDWRKALAYHRHTPTWWVEAGHRRFGPPPGQPGCRVPEHLLAEVVS